MSVNIDLLKTAYFPFDKAVPYKAGDKIIEIKPVKLIDSALYSASEPILKIDKKRLRTLMTLVIS